MSLFQSAGAVEYTDWVSAEGYDLANECPGYDTKQSDGKVPALGDVEYPFIAPRSTLTCSSSTTL